MFSTSSGSLLGSALNHASRISSSTALLVRRSDKARTFASFHLRAPRAVSASSHNAARTPATLFAAIDAPVPVQQQTTPCSARPSATSRAAASLPHAQSSRSLSVSAPCGSTSWPREISAATTASATPVRSSAATAILMQNSGKAYAHPWIPRGARNSGRASGLSTKDSTHIEPGRGPSMRRLVLIACLAALMTAGALTTADAALVAGIGDQNGSSFSDPNFKKLKVKRTRLIVAWDAVNKANGRPGLDQWMNAAKAAKLKVLVAFNPSAGSRCPARPCSIPSATAYTRALKAFRKRYSFVKEFNFWNETNSATQPTGPTKASTLKKTAALYK